MTYSGVCRCDYSDVSAGHCKSIKMRLLQPPDGRSELDLLYEKETVQTDGKIQCNKKTLWWQRFDMHMLN